MKKFVKPLIATLLAMVLLVPTVAMLVTNAADGDPVELAFNNLFIFEKWATNTLSTTVITDGVPNVEGNELTTDIEAGSFTLTKTGSSNSEVYTAFSAGASLADNSSYYMIDVKPNTTYTFSYNLSGSVTTFTPFIFMYDESGAHLSDKMVAAQTTTLGYNSFNFTTGADTRYVQVRFTINQSTAESEATVSDIIICKSEIFDSYLDSKNLFKIQDWANNSYSSKPVDSSVGTITPDIAGGKIKLVNIANTYLWTGFGIDKAASNDMYYTMDVQANTEYVLTYDIVDHNLLGPIYLQPYIVEMNSSGICLDYYRNETAHYTGNKFSFTTQGTTARIQLVFALITGDGTNNTDSTTPSRYCTVENIGIYKPADLIFDFETVTGYTHRQAYTEGTGTYGENTALPEPAAPDGYVFSGWYTGEDGTGKRITDNTTIDYNSYTVYPKFDIAVDTLSIATNPNKMTYTVGEKFNPAGLVLSASYTRTVEVQVGVDKDGDGEVDSTETREEVRVNTTSINSGYVWDPETLDTVGTQTITISYGGKSVTLDVTVIDSEQAVVTVNGTDTTVDWANNEYTFNLTAPEAFNRYEMTYYSDSYVKGTITFENGLYEDFFLEPSDNGTFASYVDKFVYTDITGAIGTNSYSEVVSIKFTSLNKEFGTVELHSLETINAPVPTETTQYFENLNYKVGINLEYGGSVSYIEDLSEGPVAYRNSDGDTEVNFASMVPSGSTVLSTSVNLINAHDRGRYLQQSYYGTNEDPFVMGNYNGDPWRYNPVQGGNILRESSKIIDYRITDEGIYIKTRPLDWGKWSDAAGKAFNEDPTAFGAEANAPTKELIYEDSYNTPSYMEAWYSFENKDLIRTDCRFVDFSGYPSAMADQELPAFYPIEPLNTLLYAKSTNEETAQPWTEDTVLTRESDLEFWGINYEDLLKKAGETYDNDRYCVENWAAFMSDEQENSFGIGLYSPGVTDFTVGQFPSIYDPDEVNKGNTTLVVNDAHRHARTANPSEEDPTTYIAPVDKRLFESYSPTTYSFFVSTGNTATISETFESVASGEIEAEYAKSKIAVPETVYMEPTTDENYTLGQYYVNNQMDHGDYYNVYTVADSDALMYFGLYVQNAADFKVNVSNVTNPDEDIILGGADGTGQFDDNDVFYNLAADGTPDEIAEFDGTLGLRFADGGGLAPGEQATAKWTITVNVYDVDENGNVLTTTHEETYTAYTVLYAPGRTVGAVAEGRYNSSSMNEISSWITGATGVDHSQRAPLSTFHGDIHDSGRFLYDPLVYDDVSVMTDIGSEENSHDYISTDHPNEIGSADDEDDYSENAYVLQTATHDSDDSSSQSYLGLLPIDKSRYTNTNQIPNLEIGYDALRVGSGAPKDSLSVYNNYYTLGTAESFSTTDLSATPSGWTTFKSYSELYDANGGVIPYREKVVPSYSVTDDMDGKYIHAIAYGKAYNLFGSKYSTASTSVLISITDKSELRDAVLDGYTKVEEDYTAATYPEFIEKLEDAATVLGDPTATQEEIDQAKKDINNVTEELTEVYYSLKYDNLFSAYEFAQHSNSMTVVANRGTVSYKDGTLTVVNDTITGGEAYTNYGTASGNYLIDLKPNTEYVFEYTSETTLKAQAFMFFYNSSGGAGDVPTNMSIKVDDGNWSAKSESNAWWGNYQNEAGTKRYAIKFTTGANTTKAGFRFGNTSNDPVTSTFSNIRLIDAAHYYADATYSKTEAVYKQYASYGTLITPVRTGYTFTGWVDAEGKAVTGADIATENKSIYSTWEVTSYTIVYNPDNGSVYPANQSYTIEDSVGLATPTRTGYTFAGWKATAAEGSWTLDSIYQGTVAAGMYGDVTLTAQWALNEFSVLFDTILDFGEWNTTTASNAAISNVTENGFTLTSNAGAGEGTSTSPYFEVTAGKTYTVDVDIEGSNWDVYVFFYDEKTSSGEGLEFDDTKNHYAAGSEGKTFTAPSGAVKAVIRLDANNASNAVTFSDIRVYEVDTRASDVYVPDTSMEAEYGSTYGTLPVPTREGYDFVGWYDENGNQITSGATVTHTSTVYLKSKWVVNDDSLVSDNVAIDFATPVKFAPLTNDATFMAEAANGTYKIEGLSADGTSDPAASVAGTYGTFTISGTDVTYTPTSAVNGKDTVYYHASLTADGVKTTVKDAITVVPASNILYEETLLQVNTAVAGKDWSTDGTAANAVQSDDGIYGYDETYNNTNKHSNNSAKYVYVDSTNKRSKILTFTFTGTGFNLYGACGNNTGIQLVTIKNNDTGKMVKSHVVDTYYADSSYGTLYQVPIVTDHSLGYGNYTVQIMASYLNFAGALQTASVESVDGMTAYTSTESQALADALAEIGMEDILDAEEVSVVWFDDDSIFNGGMGVNTQDGETLSTASVTELYNVVDSIRVYNPVEDGDDYYAEDEKYAQYYNVMNNLVNGGNLSSTGDGLFAYVSGNPLETITIDTYNAKGPKNELYLASGTNAVAFSIDNLPEGTRVMVSLRAAYGAPTVKIGNGWSKVLSNTEMYYDVTDYVVDNTVTIQNSAANTLLAVGYVKLVGETVSVASTFNLDTARLMMAAPAEEFVLNAPPTEPDVSVPDEEPDVSNPDEGTDTGSDDSTADDTNESWFIRLIKKIISVITNVIDVSKNLISKAFSVLSY